MFDDSKATDERIRVVVTGIGLCTPIGNSVEVFRQNLKEGITGIQSHEGIFKDRVAWAALVEDFHPEEFLSEQERDRYDRTAQMGIFAALQAMDHADVKSTTDGRCGLVVGTSHGGRSQLDRFVETGNTLETPGLPEQVLDKASHYHQTAAIASKLEIHGPCLTLSNACSSSGAAIGYAMELIRGGRCDWVLAGGADGFSKLTYAGFEALGAMADGPSAPFSHPIGMSLGDGAGFLLLERWDRAVARGAKIYAELFGWGLSWDAYHITAPEPSGEGMLRAMTMAVADAGIQKEEIDYINVHGTGTRANDASEAVGLGRFFADSATLRVPPLSATKSLTGHMLGASSALGVIASILGMNESWLPPTANFSDVRPGCELDVVPHRARPASIRHFVAQSAAFAGANAVIVGGQPSASKKMKAPPSEPLAVTGIGLVTPIGFDPKSFFDAYRSKRSGIVPSDGVEGLGVSGLECGAIRDYQPRKLMPSLNLRRVDRVASYATIAASLALKDANLWPLPDSGRRIGLIVAVTRGAATSYEKYLESVRGGKWKDASAVYFPNMVMSSVGGQVSSSLGIRGITSSVVGGGTAGLQAMVHAIELFQRNLDQDAVIVVASDELASLYFRLYEQHGLLKGASEHHSVILGEGSVAFVLEKTQSAKQRGKTPYGSLLGYGISHDASLGAEQTTNHWMKQAIEEALCDAKVEKQEIHRVQLLASGRRQMDCRERCVAESFFPQCVGSLESTTPLAGFAEASSSLTNLAALFLELKSQAGAKESKPRGIMISAGDDGSNVALVAEGMSDLRS